MREHDGSTQECCVNINIYERNVTEEYILHETGGVFVHDIIMFVLYCIMIALLIVATHERKTEKHFQISWIVPKECFDIGLKRYYWFAFAVCMIVGIAVRCYRFGELPAGLNQDETMAGVEALSLLRTGKDHHGISWPTYFRAWGGTQMSTLYSYYLIPFVWIFDDLNRFVLRLPALLINVAMLPVVWDMARRMLGKGFALLALFVAAVNPWHIMIGRWGLEANMMPHVFLLGVYLLVVGMEHRKALYASMVFFGLAPYAYGVASFSVPAFLLFAAVFCLVRKKVTVPQLVICVAVFAVVAWPYYYTMMINAFGWETFELGPFTMPLFERSQRTDDLVFSKGNPYAFFVASFHGHLSTYLFNASGGSYNSVMWIGPMYVFMIPVFVYGFYRIWRDRRNLAYRGSDSLFREGGMFLLFWMGAALFNGVMIGNIINRNNIVYYPLIFACAYGLYWMGKRSLPVLTAALLVVCIGFAGFVSTYYGDEEYQEQVAADFHNGLNQALTAIWEYECDRCYITTVPYIHEMFAHKMDADMLADRKELEDSKGNPTGRYYSDRYQHVDFLEFIPDPMENAVYVVRQEETGCFDPADFLIEDYEGFAVVYPRCWRE